MFDSWRFTMPHSSVGIGVDCEDKIIGNMTTEGYTTEKICCDFRKNIIFLQVLKFVFYDMPQKDR